VVFAATCRNMPQRAARPTANGTAHVTHVDKFAIRSLYFVERYVVQSVSANNQTAHLMTLKVSRRNLLALNRSSCLVVCSVHVQRIRGFTTMRYIHLRLTYLLTYLHQPVNFTQFAATFQIVMHSKASFPTKTISSRSWTLGQKYKHNDTSNVTCISSIHRSVVPVSRL